MNACIDPVGLLLFLSLIGASIALICVGISGIWRSWGKGDDDPPCYVGGPGTRAPADRAGGRMGAGVQNARRVQDWRCGAKPRAFPD